MAQVVVEMTGNEAHLLRSLQKVIAETKNVGAGFESVGRSSNMVARSIDDGFAKGLQSLRGMTSAASAFDAVLGTISISQAKFIGQMNQSVALVKELAAAQQEAAKNLSGTSSAGISEALSKKVPSIAKKAAFSDLPKLTTTMGSVSSIVGEEKASSVVEVAAQLTRFKKEELQTTATAFADIMKNSGIDDPKKVVSLALSSGSVARPEQMGKLSQALAKAIASGIAASPNAPKELVTKQSAALVSLFTELDPEGQRAAHADASLESQLGAIFNPKRDDVIKRDDRINELLKEKAVTDEEQVAIDRAQFNVAQKEALAKRVSPTDMRPAANDIRLDLREAKANLVRAQKAATLNEKDDEELRRLQATKAAASTDPGSLLGRLDVIASSPELARAFEASVSTEEIFKPIVQGLLTPGSDARKKFQKNLDAISLDPKVYDAGLESMTSTPQQKMALRLEEAATANSVKNFGDVDTQVYGSVDEIVTKALKDNPNVGLNAMGESFTDWGFARLGLPAETSVSSFATSPLQAINSGILTLKDRQAKVGDWATSDPEQMSFGARSKINSLQGSIDALEAMKADLTAATERMAKAAEDTAKAVNEQNAMVAKQTKSLEVIEQQATQSPDRTQAIRLQTEQSKAN